MVPSSTVFRKGLLVDDKNERTLREMLIPGDTEPGEVLETKETVVVQVFQVSSGQREVRDNWSGQREVRDNWSGQREVRDNWSAQREVRNNW